MNQTAIAEMLASTCPWDAPPADGAECTDLLVQYFQESPPNAKRHRQPWLLRVRESTFRYDAADDQFTLLHEREGVTDTAVGDVDVHHLRRAEFRGDVPMSDGSVIGVDLTIDEPGPLFVAGNDGPIQDGSPWGGHIVESCMTLNFLAHQIWRWDGTVAGAVSGHDLDALFLAPYNPYIGRGRFTVTVAQHQGCRD